MLFCRRKRRENDGKHDPHHPVRQRNLPDRLPRLLCRNGLPRHQLGRPVCANERRSGADLPARGRNWAGHRLHHVCQNGHDKRLFRGGLRVHPGILGGRDAPPSGHWRRAAGPRGSLAARKRLPFRSADRDAKAPSPNGRGGKIVTLCRRRCPWRVPHQPAWQAGRSSPGRGRRSRPGCPAWPWPRSPPPWTCSCSS